MHIATRINLESPLSEISQVFILMLFILPRVFIEILVFVVLRSTHK